MLQVVHKKKLTTALKKRNWEFLNRVGHTNHSAMCITLTHLIEQCENEGMPYQLEAVPGRGYRLIIKPEWKLDAEPADKG